MKHLNFFSKRQSCSHNVVTLASTVGSPSVHRQGTMLKLLSVLVLILTIGVGNAWGAVTSPITLTTNSSTVGSSGQYTNKFDYKLTFTNVTAGGNNFVQNAKSSSIYNTVTIPGSITSIKLTDCATTSTKTDGGFTVYGGTTQANCTTEVASVSGLSSTAADKTVDFSGNYTFFKITVNSARVLKISSIVIYFSAANCSTDPTVGNIMNNVSGITANGATFSTSTGVSAGTNCTLSEVGFVYSTSTNPTITTGTKVTIANYTSGNLSKSVTGLDDNTTYYVRAFATNGHGTSYSDEKSFSTPELPKYTITYNAGTGTCGTSSWTQPSYEASTTLPTATAPTTCSGWEFEGWCTSSAGDAEDNTTSPGTILTGSYQPTSDVTLYAIYKRTVNSGGSASLTKMVKGNTLSDGDKLVVVANGTDIAMYQETTSSSYVQTWDCSTLNATTVGADSKNWWTVTATTGGFYLGDATNGYLNMSSNNLYCNATQSVWTLSDLEDGTFKLQSNSRNLSYRSDLTTTKWRMGGASYGTSGQTVLDLYKYSAGGGSTTYYMTSLVCCTELAQINGSFF